MNMRTTRLALLLGIAGALILGACKRASPTQPAATTTPTQPTPTATRRPTRLPGRTRTPRPTLPGTTYPGPVQAIPVATQTPAVVSTSETTQVATPGSAQVATPVTTLEPTQVVSPEPVTAIPTQAAYPAPGAGEPTQPGAYPGPGSSYIPPTAIPNPYPGPGSQPTVTPLPATQPPAIQPSATQPPATPSPTAQPPATQSLLQPSATPTPSVGTPSPATATPNPVYSTFTPTPTFPSSFGDSQFHVTDPATVKLASGDYQLVEFFAYWCGPCRAMAPLLNSLEDQYKDRIQFAYLDIDNPATQPFKDALYFRTEPEYYLLDGQGKLVKKWSGYVSKEDFQAVFDAVLQ